MDIKFHQIKNIFDTLPIGYYLGRKIQVELSTESGTSYYNPAGDNIVISAPSIISTFKACKDLEEKDLEYVIRGLLYHEISHVILTCDAPTLKSVCYRCNKDIFNIFEDERIETILKDYYMNTNFRRNIFLLNHYDGTTPAVTDMERFYHLVRYHEGPEEWLRRLEDMIRQYRSLNAASSDWKWCDYANDIKDFYEDFTKSPMPEMDPDEGEGEDGDEGDETEEGSGKGKSSGKLPDEEDGESKEGEGEEGSRDGAGSPGKGPKAKSYEDVKEFDVGSKSTVDGLMKTASKALFGRFDDPDLQRKLSHIINVSQKKKGMLQGARMSYSGKINPRACGREDYQWWKKENDGGALNGIAKIHFNLFIDNSGSFGSNDETVNKLLRALNKIRSPLFDFDVVTMATKIIEWPDTTSQLFKSKDGNHLTANIHDIFKRHQKPGCNNFNIVLFDGDAHSNDCPYDPHYSRIGPNGKDNFSAFDTPNTILISDHQNQGYIQESVFKAKVKFTRNYTSELIDNILLLLEQMM